MGLADIRSRISRAVELGGAWRRSRFSPEQFGKDARSLAPYAFVVGFPGPTTPLPDRGTGRGVRHATVQVVTSVVVRWSYPVRGDAQDSDYDDALAREEELTSLLVRSDQVEAGAAPSGFLVRLVRVSERRVTGAWFVGAVELEVLHAYDLEAA